MWECRFRLIKEHLFVGVTRGEMADEESFGVGFACKFGCLTSCAVTRLASKRNGVGGEGGFVIEEIDATKELGIMIHGHGVAAIGIASSRLRGKGELMVRPDAAVGVCPVCSLLDGVDGVEGDVEEVDHIAADVRKGRLLGEKKSATGHTMFQRDGGDAERTIIIDGL